MDDRAECEGTLRNEIEIYFQRSDSSPASDGWPIISRAAAFDTVIKAINHA